MNIRYSIGTHKRSTRFAPFGLVLVVSLFIGHPVKAEIVELSITGYWSERDFKVTDKLNRSYDPADPKFDGKVFGLAPSAGNLTLQLLVNTDAVMSFPKGTGFTADGVGAYSLEHDFYGYREVLLVGDAFSFGSAAWRPDGIVAGLEGPDGSKAALWTDVDITKKDPTRISFRMFGKSDGLMADLFVGSRTHRSIGMQFLLWEYYKGEEIRSMKYTARAKTTRN